MKDDIKELIGTHLGKNADGKISAAYQTPDKIDRSLLVAIPREANRVNYEITNETFYGYDNWYCYECSALTDKGLPVYFGLIISYSAHSKFIVESKSLKLYLNSFNMTKIGSNSKNVIDNYKSNVEFDLVNLLQTQVNVIEFQDSRKFINYKIYQNIDTMINVNDVEFTNFSESPEILKFDEFNKMFSVKIEGLRSNCRVTNQPDWATCYIEFHSQEKGVDLTSLLQYIVSFRNENHFHEEVCEMIFKRLKDKYDPTMLTVFCNYTRRGGIDINPLRTTMVVKNNPTVIFNRTVYQ